MYKHLLQLKRLPQGRHSLLQHKHTGTWTTDDVVSTNSNAEKVSGTKHSGYHSPLIFQNRENKRSSLIRYPSRQLVLSLKIMLHLNTKLWKTLILGVMCTIPAINFKAQPYFSHCHTWKTMHDCPMVHSQNKTLVHRMANYLIGIHKAIQWIVRLTCTHLINIRGREAMFFIWNSKKWNCISRIQIFHLLPSRLASTEIELDNN